MIKKVPTIQHFPQIVEVNSTFTHQGKLVIMYPLVKHYDIMFSNGSPDVLFWN